MDIQLKTIEERIRNYQVELAVLRQTHEQMVATAQQQQQEFQTRASENQAKFQQLTGRIAELEQLAKEVRAPSNDEPPKRKHKLEVDRL